MKNFKEKKFLQKFPSRYPRSDETSHPRQTTEGLRVEMEEGLCENSCAVRSVPQVKNEVINAPVCPRLKGLPENGTFSAENGQVSGKPGPLVTLVKKQVFNPTT